MKHLVPATLIVLALTSALAWSSERLVPVYMVNGKVVTAQDALTAALADKPVTLCKPVVAVVAKSGTSIHLASRKLAKNP